MYAWACTRTGHLSIWAFLFFFIYIWVESERANEDGGATSYIAGQWKIIFRRV